MKKIQQRRERRSQRVVLRTPLQASIDEQPILVLELSAGGARIEHAERLINGMPHRIRIGDVDCGVAIRHSKALPTSHGLVFHSGVEFLRLRDEQSAGIHDMILAEAQEQMRAWEANLQGVPVPHPVGPRSAVSPRYIWLRLTPSGWVRAETSDPNQPIDGVAVSVDEPREAVALLCETYEKGDDRTRDYLRHCAMLAILERSGTTAAAHPRSPRR